MIIGKWKLYLEFVLESNFTSEVISRTKDNSYKWQEIEKPTYKNSIKILNLFIQLQPRRETFCISILKSKEPNLS